MRPQSCKAKGRRLQQRTCAALLETFDSLEKDDVRSTSMGAGGEDVQLSPAARKLIPFSIECKNTEKLSLVKAFAQAATHVGSPGVSPCVVFSRNRADTYVALKYDHPWAVAAGSATAPVRCGNVWTLIEKGMSTFVLAELFVTTLSGFLSSRPTQQGGS